MKSWKEFALVLALCALVAGYNLRPPAKTDSHESSPVNLRAELGEAKREIALLQWDADPEMAEWCKGEIEAWTGVTAKEVFNFSGIPIAVESLDRDRGQDDADEIIKHLSAYYSGQNIAGIAVTRKDLFLSSKPEWRYCFGSHGPNNIAILSSFRMGGDAQAKLFPSELAEDRFRKMLLRYVLEMVYDLPRNDDPKSLLFQGVLGPQDLDQMEYRI